MTTTAILKALAHAADAGRVTVPVATDLYPPAAVDNLLRTADYCVYRESTNGRDALLTIYIPPGDQTDAARIVGESLNELLVATHERRRLSP